MLDDLIEGVVEALADGASDSKSPMVAIIVIAIIAVVVVAALMMSGHECDDTKCPAGIAQLVDDKCMCVMTPAN